MGLSELTTNAVRAAIKEFDDLGREAALSEYGFGKAVDYFVVEGGHYYDSKALAGMAHSFLSPSSPVLSNEDFSGGEGTVRQKLESLGFVVTGPDTLPFIGAAPGDVLSNSELSRRFSIGNMGGMRRNARAHHLVLISDPSKGLYDDRLEGDIIHYTGMGKVGDQTLSSQNRTLAESSATGEIVHLFEALEPKRYTYMGQVVLDGAPYQETQPDENGDARLVWMFPLRRKPGSIHVLPKENQVKEIVSEREKKVSKLSIEELRKRAGAKKKKPPKRTVESEQFSRDPVVVELVKRLADGNCDLCKQPAPFTDKKKRPYFECHHIVHLAKGGDDTVSNAVALCPNCHRKMHALDRKADIKALQSRVAERDRSS